MHETHVVIIGGGFGGLYAAKALRKSAVRITLIDRRNHHLFQPLLYQVATAGLSGTDIAAPLRRVLSRQRNVRVRLGEVTRIDAPASCVFLGGERLSYDYLVVAIGATNNYFGHADWAPFAPALKSLADALDIRQRVLLAYEAADAEPDPARRRALLTFIVVGGGPTGVELAGALAEIAHHTMARDFRSLDMRECRVMLVEGQSRVLGAFAPDLSLSALSQLTRLGVEVRTGTQVTAIDAGGVTLGGERIPARTVVWAAGIAGEPLARTLEVPLDRAGRVLVEPDLSVPGHRDVFVIGDIAAVVGKDGRPVPGLAPAAIQMGRHAARNLERRRLGEPTEPFAYADKGIMATIGRSKAVLERNRLHLSGFLAWVGWLAVHIFFLIGFRNRFVVLFEWAYAYLTYERSARIILEERDASKVTRP